MKRSMMVIGTVFVGFVLTFIFQVKAQAQLDCAAAVETEFGLVSGAQAEGRNVCVWKGIPYAAAPVGDLRWRAPQPHEGWSGVREALEFGDRCVQSPTYGVTWPRKLPKGMSEDCLYLNIWRPKKEGAFPVMVWIHGGGYMGGSGDIYDGSALAEFGDVVVVTINYRLGIFGFLAHPAAREEDPNKSTGNYGSLDQVAALRWVHENIAGFGGDPQNITIFGESAGGWSVCTMLATPLNKGLFHKAILESGGCEASADLLEGYVQADAISKRLFCEINDLSCLRQVSALELLNRGNGSVLEAGFQWVPHHDGYLLVDTPLAMIRTGNYNRVPFIAGANRDEVDAVLLFRPEVYKSPAFLYPRNLKKSLGLSDDEVWRLTDLYPLSDFGNNTKEAYGQVFSDLGLICPTYLGLAAAAEHQEDTYLYRFDYDQMRFGKVIGAMHAMEVPFVFGLDSTAGKALYNNRNLAPARDLSRIIQGYWTNFAKTGNPNAPGLPEWPQFRPETQLMQVLDAPVHTIPAGMEERCAFWDDYNRTHPPIFRNLLGKKEGE